MIHTLKHFWFGHILVIIGVIMLINLGFWQLRRLEERRALNAEIEAGLRANPTPLTGQPVDPVALHRHRVTVTGALDNAANIIIKNRPFLGQAGVELVTPLKITGSEQAVLINRGWIPLDQMDSAARRAYDVTGPVTIEGIAYRSQPQPSGYLVVPDPTLAPGQTRLDDWFRVDVDGIGRQLDYPLLPLYVRQSPGSNPDEMPLRAEEFDLSEGSHLGYAIQWFTFALILVIVYFSLLWQEAKKYREEQQGDK
jgi:surfeit locus 1 family protein